MIAKLYTAALTGIDCNIVEVEVDYRRGNTYFSIVGLAGKSIQEAKDRIPAAIKNSSSEYIPMKIIVNLAPAELHKSGPSYDLPIAIAYLLASEQISFNFENKLFLGELALNGDLRPVNGVLPIASEIRKIGFKEIYVPYDNANEASLVDGLSVYGAKNLKEFIDHFTELKNLKAFETIRPLNKDNRQVQFDLKDVKGQAHAKRALEIAASGGHNILMSGVPGSGKTMIARCLPGILPDLEVEESLEITRIYSVAGLTSRVDPLIKHRPFRTPHHTSSEVALVGGGTIPKPGEISLSHRGVLFLDEFPEFSSQALEALRQPLEDRIVTISRAAGTLTFPANFILAAAMNPCKCGYKGDPKKECTCSQAETIRYRKKISGPILDRIDLLINIYKVENEELFDDSFAESSADVKKRVQKARDMQVARFGQSQIFSNAEMSQNEIKKFVPLDEDSKDILQVAISKMNLSARSYYRLLKVARTIADLAGEAKVTKKHIMEALSYRVEIG